MFKRRQKEAAVQADAGQKKVFEKVQKIIAERTDTEPGNITENTVLARDLQVDDIGIFEIAMDLEEEFEIEIPNDCQEWTTVEDIMNTLETYGIK